MSNDLVKRLRERGDHNRYLGKQNYVPSMQEGFTKEGDLYHEAADIIAALESQVKAADGLAQALRDIIDTGGAFGTAAHLVRIDAIARAALATYRAAKEAANAKTD